MKELRLLVVAFLFVAVPALAAIQGTKHDFTTASGPGTKLTNATLCGTCHIPHGGSTATAGLPIWARESPSGPYNVYGDTGTPGSSFTVSGTTVNDPGTFSLICLGCHDGSIGINTITKNGVSTSFAVSANTAFVNSGGFVVNVVNATTGYSPFIDVNLQNDHPVGLTYRGTAASLAGLIDADNASSVGGGVFPLFTNIMECASCHDPHNSTNSPFLRAAKATICQDCHANK
jgi:predicted CXXCH cytochrome family protein